MADRFFPNVMPDFVAEATAETQDEEGKEPVVVTQDSLMKLLSMPYSSLSQRFKRAALDLKETVSISFTHYFLCLCVCNSACTSLLTLMPTNCLWICFR